MEAAEPPTLRITHTVGSGGELVEVELTGTGRPRRAMTTGFHFRLDADTREDLRWYFEDYLLYPAPPAPEIAKTIEGKMAEIGRHLFEAVFGSDDARDLWASVREQLPQTRVEVAAGVREAITLPWELLRDPKTDVPLALTAQSFTRSLPNPARVPTVLEDQPGEIRILLVICRPRGGDDVPFRSVATHLIRGLGPMTGARIRLDVLRPPTFEQLSRVLRGAAPHAPYHIVHFDGHGFYGSVDGAPPRGYLVFEHSDDLEKRRDITGTQLGSLLAEAGVPVLVLNACQSAHADPPARPRSAPVGEADEHAEVRSFGSLAQEVMDAGSAGVVAMAYTVFVVTAAQFIGDLYGALRSGRSLADAVALGRKQLEAQPQREVVTRAIPLQDWPVPIVYEAAPLRLFGPGGELPVIDLSTRSAMPTAPGTSQLPRAPDIGFIGRDETLLALDRGFDDHSSVLLTAYAGSGKTTTAAEFGRWYATTGGAERVMFTSFEQHMPLARVLNAVGETFADVLEANGIEWLALGDTARREVALRCLNAVRTLWIWDNVESVAGFPSAADSAWSADEQRELGDFLRDLRDSQAKVLLTSRRDERAWLGDLPLRIEVPPMPIPERIQFAQALARRGGTAIRDLAAWKPVLEYSDGNPLTLTVIVRAALREQAHDARPWHGSSPASGPASMSSATR